MPRGDHRADATPGDFAQDVLELVAQVPSARATTYGDVAHLLGRGSARAVGQVMSRFGSDVPWWRVVRADGGLHDGLLDEARRRWAAEGMPVRAVDGAVRVDLDRAGWDAAGAWVPR